MNGFNRLKDCKTNQLFEIDFISFIHFNFRFSSDIDVVDGQLPFQVYFNKIGKSKNDQCYKEIYPSLGIPYLGV